MKRTILLSLVTLVCLGLYSQTVTYTIQTGNFNSTSTIHTNANYFAGAYNNNATEVGLYANGSGAGYTGDPGVSCFQTFTDDGTITGNARPLAVGDQFQITCYVANSSSFFASSSAGISFNENTTYSGFSDYNTNQRIKFQINQGGNWFPAASSNGLGYATPGQDVTFTFKLTSTKSANLIISSVNGATTYDMELNNSPTSSSPITSFAIWNQTSGGSNDMYWKNGSLSSTGTVEVGGNDNTTTIAGVISDGIPANSTTGTVTNSLTKSGTGTITLSANNTYTGTTSVDAGTLKLQGDLASSTITVASGATLQIDGAVEVNSIVNNGEVVVLSGSDLKINGTYSGTGTFTMERGITNDNGWHLLSSPVSNQTIIGSTFVPSGSPLPTTFDFYSFDESVSDLPWINIRSGDNTPNGSFDAQFVDAKGYLVAYSASYGTTTFEFTGDINTGTVTTQTLTYSNQDGANLIGNPYPSSIDWSSADKSLFADVYAYVYNEAKSGGAGYEEVTGTIAPNQGFFVLRNSGVSDGTFDFTTALQTTGGSFLKTAFANELILKVSNEEFYDETSVVLNSQSNENRDKYDAVKFFSYDTRVPQMYTSTNDGVKTAINSINEISETLSIPLNVNVNSETICNLSIANVSGVFIDQIILIEDLKTAVIFNLSEIVNYAFNASPTDDPNRFVVHFSAVGTEEINNNELINVWSKGNEITILNNSNSKGDISIMNITGQIMSRFDLSGNQKQKLKFDATTGIYIVNIKTNDGSSISKKVIIN